MEELIKEHMVKLKAEEEAKKAAAKLDADSDEEDGEALHHVRIKKLRRDIRHVISHDQRKIALQRLDEKKKDEEERKKAEEEKSAKEGEKPIEEEKPKEEKAKEEKKAEPDSDDSPEEELVLIDFDNLPENREERHRLLEVEIDPELAAGGDDLLMMIEQGAIDEKKRQ